MKERLRYFAGRGQMDIENLGVALIEQLVDTGLVKNFADLYKLQKADLINLERMADKSAINVIQAIKAAISLHKGLVLLALIACITFIALLSAIRSRFIKSAFWSL